MGHVDAGDTDRLAQEIGQRIRERARDLFSKKWGGLPYMQRSAEAKAVIESIAHELAELRALIAKGD